MLATVHADRGTGPAVVYVPGIDGTGELLLGTAARLAARFRLVCLRYQTAPGAADYARLAASVADCLQALGIERAVLLAESFGGGVALHTVLARPERIAGLALVNTFARFPSRLRLAATRLVAPCVPRPLFALGRRLGGVHALFGARREADAVREFRALAGAHFDRGYRLRLRLLAGLDLRARLGEITQPALVVVGTQDRVVAPAAGRTLHAGLPRARLEIVDGGGHALLPLASLPWAEWLAGLLSRAGSA